MVVLHPPPFTRSADLNYELPSDVLTALQRTKWCRYTLNDPSYIPLPSYSRNPPLHIAGRYTLMSKTFNTDSTVRIWQTFYSHTSGEVRILVSLGPDLDGHLHTAHGGVVSLLMDEAMGTLAGIHKEKGKTIFTAYMRVEYKKPVPTPSVVLLRVRLDPKSEGRKIFVLATLEDGEGVVYTGAESLFLEVERGRDHKPKLKL